MAHIIPTLLLDGAPYLPQLADVGRAAQFRDRLANTGLSVADYTYSQTGSSHRLMGGGIGEGSSLPNGFFPSAPGAYLRSRRASAWELLPACFPFPGR